MGFSYHEGELEAQRRNDSTERAGRMAAGVHDELPPIALEFLGRTDLVVLASVDDRGRPWATVLSDGAPALTARDPRTLRLATTTAAGDPVLSQLQAGRPVALLALEFATRRRMRVNGTVSSTGTGVSNSPGAVELVVGEAYGNCPKYIQARAVGPSRAGEGPVVATAGLSEVQKRWITTADTFFITTTDGGARADVSHRGGRPGFVTVAGDRLVWRDYPGNDMFNTLGNLLQDERAGLLFLDFESGGGLHLTGRSEVRWSPAGDGEGTERSVAFTVDQVVERPGALAHAWPLIEPSPFNPPL